MTSNTRQQRVLSGIQPTGTIHLGNYLGAVRNWVQMQSETDAYFCVVDLHSLSVPRPAGEIRQATLDLATDLFAAGLDPAEATIFVQSQVPEHTELTWHMQCVAAFGELKRMTQFKDKSEGAGFISSALFTYPTLQAADILLYDADIVPVGDDQRQHLEFTRDIAERFNRQFGDVLVIPEHQIPATGARVMDLQRPTRKMSKSSETVQGTIFLNDTDAEIERKIKRAVTDTDNQVAFDPKTKPGVSNLLTLLAVATESAPEQLAEKYEQYGPLKADTAEALINMLRPIRQRRAELDETEVVAMLKSGGEKARETASSVMERVRDAVGLL